MLQDYLGGLLKPGLEDPGLLLQLVQGGNSKVCISGKFLGDVLAAA